MSFRSEELSELTNESDELDQLFQKIKNAREKRQDRVEMAQSTPKQSFLKSKFSRLSIQSESSFLESSFGTNSDDEIFEFVAKRFEKQSKQEGASEQRIKISSSTIEQTQEIRATEEQTDGKNDVQAKEKGANNAERGVALSSGGPVVLELEDILNETLTLPDESGTENDAKENVVIDKEEVIEQDGFEIADDEDDVEFGDFVSYMNRKRLKQQNADNEYLKWCKAQGNPALAKETSDIFKDCVIYVNGYTDPSIYIIQQLVVLNGGKFIHHLTNKSSATHIVASKLTPSKHKEFKNYRVVSPFWIVESVQSKKLLNWRKFAIIRSRDFGQSALPVLQSPSQRKDEENEGNNHVFDNKALKDDDMQNNLAQDLNLAVDARHPNFLKKFFEASRLHHLSLWRSNLRSEYLIKSIEALESKSMSSSKGILFYIDFDCFFVTASAMNYPDLDINKHPLCVTHGKSTSDVSSCNYVARNFGVKNGMWIRDAKKLCPDLVSLTYDFERYEKISRVFYDYLLHHENVSCLLPVSVDECVVKIKGLREDQCIDTAKAIKKDIKELTMCDLSIGIAPTKILARLCLKKAKPNGMIQVDSNTDVKAFLGTFPFCDLPGVGFKFANKMVETYFPNTNYKSLLLKDIFDSKLDINQLTATFGEKIGLRFYNFLQGKDSQEELSLEKVVQDEYRRNVLNKDSISIDVNWGIRFDNTEQLQRFCQDLIRELVERMSKLNKSGSVMTLKLMKRKTAAEATKYLGMGECDVLSKSSRLGLPTNDYGILFTEIMTIYKMLNVSIEDLRGIGVKMSKLLNNQAKTEYQFEYAERDKVEKECFADISMSVFEALPKELQKEVLIDQKSRKLKEKIEQTSVKRKLQQMQSIDLSDNSSISVNTTQDLYLMRNSNVDKVTFEALPPSIQRELITNWERQEFKFKNVNYFDFLNDVKKSKKFIKRELKVKKLDRQYLNTVCYSGNRNFKFDGKPMTLPQIQNILQKWTTSSLDDEKKNAIFNLKKDMISKNSLSQLYLLCKKVKGTQTRNEWTSFFDCL